MNEELIKRLREFRMNIDGWLPFSEAADALEAADRRIKELEAQLGEYRKDAERYKFLSCNIDIAQEIFAYDQDCMDDVIDAAIKESER